jgi:hypothetical protein
MHTSEPHDDGPGETEARDAGESNYRTLSEIFERAINDDDFPEGQITRLEIRLLASGDATYNVWTEGADEPVGGYVAPD